MEETKLFRALGSADRQIVLHELITAEGESTEEELSRQVAARRHRLSPEKVTEEQIRRAHVRLVHAHLPLLHELDVIERDGATVALPDERRGDLQNAAEALESWPPDGPLQHPTS